MGDLVGIIRRRTKALRTRWSRLAELRERVAKVSAGGRRALQPGLAPGAGPAQHAGGLGVHGAAALEREESRGGHTREDFPAMDPSGGR